MDAAALKFVRFQKTTLVELQRRAAEKAQQILEKQVRGRGWGAGLRQGDDRGVASGGAAPTHPRSGPRQSGSARRAVLLLHRIAPEHGLLLCPAPNVDSWRC